MRHVMASTYQRATRESTPDFVTPSAVLSVFTWQRRSEPVTDLQSEHPRTGNAFGHHELVGRGKGALQYIGQVLRKEFRRPRILRDSDGGVILRDRWILE